MNIIQFIKIILIYQTIKHYWRTLHLW